MSLDAARAVADALSAPAVFVQAADGSLAETNRAFLRMVGRDRDELLGRPLSGLAANGPDEIETFLGLCARSRSPMPGAITLPDGRGAPQDWRIDGNALAAPLEGILFLQFRPRQAAQPEFALLSDRVAELTREIVRRRAAEAHKNFLIKELNHRVKNTLAIVQSICESTLRGSIAPQAQDTLRRRLAALSRSHSLVVGEDAPTAGLRAVVAQALEPFAGRAPSGRAHIDGPEVRLPPKHATSLSLAFHELATNAAKYGALHSACEGRVTVTWQASGREVRLRWEESGGPPVTAPARSGFGTRLVERGLPHDIEAAVEMSFRPTGLVCDIAWTTAVLEGFDGDD